MPECTSPLWPCAMTGAAACLAGFRGISVVIHGSSGCYYYPATLLHAPLHGTFMLEHEVICGSEDRLREVIASLDDGRNRIAVITTCVPAITGEDIRSALAGSDIILVESPGFAGDAETGYIQALSLLAPQVDPGAEGVNVDGICLLDPFFAGNLQEIRRLLTSAGVPVATVFCDDALETVSHAAALTVGTNGDYASGVGEGIGGTLGLGRLRETFGILGDRIGGSDVSPVLSEIDRQESELVRICEKFLRRSDPPSVAIFAGSSYAAFAADTLRQYLDADIRFLGLRNPGSSLRYPCGQVSGLQDVKAAIAQYDPDLVLGSSFERSVSESRSFVGMTPPLRGKVRLAPVPLAGINGTLSFMETVLNACMDRRVHRN